MDYPVLGVSLCCGWAFACCCCEFPLLLMQCCSFLALCRFAESFIFFSQSFFFVVVDVFHLLG